MTDPVLVGSAGVKFIKDSNTKMMTLHFPATSGTLSLHDDTATDYQVPAGKKFCIISVKTHAGAPFPSNYGSPLYTQTGIGSYLYKNTTTDTTTGGTLILTNFASGGKMQYGYTLMNPGASTVPVPDMDCYMEVAAGNFLVCQALYTYSGMTVVGVECNV